MDSAEVLDLFDELASAVRAAVATADRAAGGERPGQYRLDLDADAVVVPRLLDAGLGVLSEESGRHGADRDVCVVVDPVDGSTNASRGLPCWATSLCAVDAEGPWVATVVDHSRQVTYRAVRGGGAARTDADGTVTPLAVAAEVPLGAAIVAVNGRRDPWPEARQFRALGSVAIELCLLAEGALDAVVNLDGDAHGAWDYLGGLLMVREAGGVAEDRAGRDLVALGHADRRSVAAASGPALLAAIMGR